MYTPNNFLNVKRKPLPFDIFKIQVKDNKIINVPLIVNTSLSI